jgi:hypothetical protein
VYGSADNDVFILAASALSSGQAQIIHMQLIHSRGRDVLRKCSSQVGQEIHRLLGKQKIIYPGMVVHRKITHKICIYE